MQTTSVAPYRHFHRIAWLAVALTLCVVVFGAFVRLSDAGLSCPDWPTCYGRDAWPKAVDEAASHVASEIRPLETHKAWREQVRSAAAAGGCIAIRGGDTKAFYGRPTAGEPLDTRGLRGIVSYEIGRASCRERVSSPV